MPVTRRQFLARSAAIAVAAQFPAVLRAAPTVDRAEAGATLAHAEMVRRFVDQHGVVLDYTDLDGSYERATPEDCQLGKPNALAWWTPVENGAMFNGLWFDAPLARALATRVPADVALVRRLVGGLLLLSSVSPVRGFVARCVATDGRTTYPMGSQDQTLPWCYALWRYLRSGLAEPALRSQIVAQLTAVGAVLETTGWRMPAAEPFRFRGGIAAFDWDDAPRLLFLLKMLHDVTGDDRWDAHYRRALDEPPQGEAKLTRRALCGLGLETRPRPVPWTGSIGVAALRALWELERDPALRANYARALAASANFAATFLPRAREWDNDATRVFVSDWRRLNNLWREQRTEQESQALAREQLQWLNRESPQRREELRLVRESAFAAWIVTLCPDQSVIAAHRPALLATVSHYRSDRLRYSQFFPVENAWWRLRATL